MNQQAPRASTQPSALNSPVAVTRPAAPSLGPCFFCNALDHGHRVCPSYLRACQHDPTLASKCPACRAPGRCPVSCPRRQYFIRSTRFPYLEVDRFGHSAVLTSSSHGQSSAEALVDQLRREQLGGPAVTENQVERLVGFWLSSAERLAALVGPSRISLREFLNGAYRAGQALLGMTVANTVPSRPVDAPAAPYEPSASVPNGGAGRPSNFPSTPEEATPPPPLPNLGTEEFRLPESVVTARNPPQQLGMDGLLNVSAGRSPADDASLAPVVRKREPQQSFRKQSNPLRNARAARGGDVVQLL
ncbi:hypothetical protein Emag_007797 [Eimeria magna]